MKVIGVLCLLMALTSGSLTAGPVMKLSESEFNFGKVPQNSSIHHIFIVENTGDDTLRIDKVVPGCGCTKAPLKKSILAAGEKTELEIIFSTRRYSREVSKHPRIYTNADSVPRQVVIRADVMPDPREANPVAVTPYKLNLTQFGDRVRSEIKFSLENKSDQPLQPSIIDLPQGLVSVQLPEVIAPQSSADALVTVLPSGLDSEFDGSITLALNDTDGTRLTIPLTRKLMETAASD